MILMNYETDRRLVAIVVWSVSQSGLECREIGELQSYGGPLFRGSKLAMLRTASELGNNSASSP